MSRTLPAVLFVLVLSNSATAADTLSRKSSVFSGPKVNHGRVIHTREGPVEVLTLSDDFMVPDTPAPHWQVVDSKGSAYLLQSLKIKGDKINNSIRVPSYVPDIAKVQIWCAWAETLLGEAAFDRPGKVNHQSTVFSGAKVNRGYVTHKRVRSTRVAQTKRPNKGAGVVAQQRDRGIVDVLTLSDDFVVPDTPAPHWQVVDSKGNVYLLMRLKIKGDKTNNSIRVPSYVPDVAKVQIWCAWAETLLGEAAFDTPLKVASR